MFRQNRYQSVGRGVIVGGTSCHFGQRKRGRVGTRRISATVRYSPAPLEVNIFHHRESRIHAISDHLKRFGSGDVLKPSSDAVIEGMSSGRRYINPDGIAIADVVFVPLEDGDRCGALRAAGKSGNYSRPQPAFTDFPRRFDHHRRQCCSRRP